MNIKWETPFVRWFFNAFVIMADNFVIAFYMMPIKKKKSDRKEKERQMS